ncbi:hypothetical protein D3C77_286490 [compost metagenome]
MPPWIWIPSEAMSTAFSVLQPLTTGIIRSTRACDSWRLAGSGWRSAQSIAAATAQARARMASVRDFIDSSMRRTSGWRMIATLLRCAAPISLPWIRSRA